MGGRRASHRRRVLVAAALLGVVLVLAGCGRPPSAGPSSGATVTLGPAGPFGGTPPDDDISGDTSAYTPVTVSTLSEPMPVPGTDGRVHLAYELLLTNTESQPATITAVEVRSADRPLLRLDGDALAPWIKPLSGALGSRTLGPGETGVVWLDVTYAPADPAPRALVHRVDVGYGQPHPPLVPAALTETVATTAVSAAPPVRISPPLAGPNWLDGDSCCTVGGHRGAVNPVDGRFWAAERYAIDYIQLDSSGRILTGDPTRIASYPYYGTDVLAVADGPILANVTNLPDQKPGADPTGLTLPEYSGDHVVQDIGGGHYAFYAHLQPGNPLNLAVGQVLHRGQVLGKLGNSGNTKAPHLHFHVMDGPDPVASNGLPYVFDTFGVAARAASEQSLLPALTGPVPIPLSPAGAGPRTDELPLTLDVVSYPAAP